MNKYLNPLSRTLVALIFIISVSEKWLAFARQSRWPAGGTSPADDRHRARRAD
jgi:hypothetical protein